MTKEDIHKVLLQNDYYFFITDIWYSKGMPIYEKDYRYSIAVIVDDTIFRCLSNLYDVEREDSTQTEFYRELNDKINPIKMEKILKIIENEKHNLIKKVKQNRISDKISKLNKDFK